MRKKDAKDAMMMLMYRSNATGFLALRKISLVSVVGGSFLVGLEKARAVYGARLVTYSWRNVRDISPTSGA